MAKPTTPIFLLIEREGQETRTEEFNENIVKIGKLASVNLRLDDPHINRIHAVIEVLDNEEAQVIDMGSSKGTRVNGKRVHKNKVVTGDELLLGETTIKIFIGEEAVAQARIGNYAVGGASAAAAAEAPSDAGFTPASMGADVGLTPDNLGVDTGIAGIDLGIGGDDDLLGSMGMGADANFESTSVTRNPLLDADLQGGAEPDTSQHSEEAAQAVREAVQTSEATAQTSAVAEQQAEAYQVPQQVQYEAQPEPDYNIQAPQQPQQAYVQQPQQAYTQEPQQAYAQGYDPNAQAAAYAQQQPSYGQMPQVNYNQQPQGYPDPQAAAYAQQQGYDPNAQAYGGYPQQPMVTGGYPQQPMATGGYPQQPMATGGYPQQPMATGGYPQQPMAPQPSIAAPAPQQPLVMDAQYADTQEALEVRVLWGDRVLDHAHFYSPKKITIGESRKNTFSLSTDALPAEMSSFTLIESKGDRLMVNFTPQMEGTVLIKDQLFTLEQIKQSAKVERTEFGHQFALPAQSKVNLTLGHLDFAISFVPAPKRIAPNFFSQMDLALARAMGASFLIHGLAVLFMLLSDEAPRGLDENFFKQPNRFAQLIVRPPEEEEEKKKKKDSGGARAKNKEGKMGQKNKEIPKNVIKKAGQIKKNPDGTAPIDMQKVEKELLDKVGKKGMLGLLGGGQSSYGAILSAKGFGGDDADAVGNFLGGKVGAASGDGGLGVRSGGGMGGGGLSGLGVGVGNLGTYGRGGGKGGRGWGKGRLRRKRSQTVDVSTGPPMVFGSLDKEIIRRVINNHRRRIKYCYERELNKYPNLQGKIKVFFQIEGNGRVSTASVKATTMNNERVEECLVRRVKIMRFPAPKGGGIVQVNYPFFFKPS